MTSLLRIFVLLFLFSSANLSIVFAEETSESTSTTETSLPETLKEKKAKEGYVVNLKDLVEKSKKKIELVNDKLQEEAKRRRNILREEKAREYYEKAMRLNDDGKYAEAQEYFKKAIEITEHPEMKGYIHESIKRSKRKDAALRQEEERRLARLEIERGYSAKEVEKTYDVGVSLFKQKKYLEAKDEFEKVDEMFPDHKATRSYLMVIEQEIQKEQQKYIDEKLRQEALAKRSEKEAWRKQLEAKEKDRQQKIEEQAETIYQQALKFYKIRQFQQAKDKFKEVEWIIPNYRSTGDYLARIDGDIRDEEKHQVEEQKLAKIREAKEAEEEKAKAKRREELKSKQKELAEKEKIRQKGDEAEFVYNAAVALYKKDLFADAQIRFEEVEKLSPNYKDTQKYLEKISEMLNKDFADSVKKDKKFQTVAEKKKQSDLEVAEKKKDDENKKLAAKAYRDGVDLYKRGLYKIATEKFQEAEKISPNYKKTRDYLEKLGVVIETTVDDKVAESDQSEETKSEETKEQLAENGKVSDPKINVVNATPKATPKKDIKEIDNIYNQAVKLFKQKKIALAKAKFEEVIAQEPHYRSTDQYLRDIALQVNQANRQLIGQSSSNDDGIIDQAVKERRAKFQSEAEKKYAEAMTFYKSKNFVEAKRKLIQVEAIAPDFKETAKYLANIDNDIDNALSSGIVPQEPKSTKKSWFSRTEVESVEPEVVEKFKQAVAMYNENNLTAAQDLFKEVEEISPGYKTTRKYLKAIEKKLGNTETADSEGKVVEKPVKIVKGDFEKSFESEARDIYREAVNLYRAKRYEEAKNRFSDVEQISPNYKDTQKFLIAIEEKLAQLNKTSESQKVGESKTEPGQKEKTLITKDEKKEIEDLYRDAVALFKSKRFDESREKFEAIKDKKGNYKKTNYYLSEIPSKKLAQEYTTTERNVAPPPSIEAKKKMTEDEMNEQFLNRSVVKVKPVNVPVSPTPQKLSKDDAVAALEAYKEAKLLFDSAKYIDAKNRFLDVQHKYGNFKKTQKYLDLIAVKMLSQDGASTILAVEGQEGLERALRDQERVAELKALEEEKERRQEEAFKLYKKNLSDQDKLMENAGSERRNILKSRTTALQNKIRNEKRQKLLKEKQESLAKSKLLREQNSSVVKSPKVETDNREVVTSEIRSESQPEQQEVNSSNPSELLKINNDVNGDSKTANFQQDNNRGIILPGGVQEAKEIDPSRQAIIKESQARLELKHLRHEQNKLEKVQKGVVRKEESTIRKELTIKEIEQRKRWTAEIDDMYKEAIRYYRQKKYKAAKIKFSAIENIYPGYKEAKKFMEDCDTMANALTEREEMVVRKEKAEQLRIAQIAEKKEKEEKARQERIALEAKQKAEKEEQLAMRKKLEQEKKDKAKSEALFKTNKSESSDTVQTDVSAPKVIKESSADLKLKAKLEAERKKKESELAQKKKELESLEKKLRAQENNISAEDVVAQTAIIAPKENVEDVVIKLGDKEKKSRVLTSVNNSKLAKADQEKIRLLKLKEKRDIAFQKRKEELDRRLNKAMLEQLKINYSQREKQLEASIERQPKGIRKEEQRQIELRRKEELQALEKRIKAEEKRIAEDLRKSKEPLLPKIKSASQIQAIPKAPKIITPSSSKVCPMNLDKGVIAKNIQPMASCKSSDEPDVDRRANSIRGDLDNLVKNQRLQLAKERERLRIEFNDRLEQLYQKALTFYKSGSFDTAMKMFNDIESLSPGYKKTRSFIEELRKPHIDSDKKPSAIHVPNTQPQLDRSDLISEALDAVQQSK